MHYIIRSGLLECLEFPIETTGEESVACMLSFSYEDRINVYSFTARVAYGLAEALYVGSVLTSHRHGYSYHYYSKSIVLFVFVIAGKCTVTLGVRTLVA